MSSRRDFIKTLAVIPLLNPSTDKLSRRNTGKIMTVMGEINADEMGRALIHEHILVDFIGASRINADRWNKDDVMKKMQPYLSQVKELGCQTFVDCTPNYLGRDVDLLKKISASTGLNIITNTGYYGGSDNKFLPKHAFDETAEDLAERWTQEFTLGIDGTDIRPGFIKISVNDSTLSPVSRKLIEAAAITHKQTGLTIASHTGKAIPALEQLEVLARAGVDGAAFIWVHAQSETDWKQFVIAARNGCWISLDGLQNDVAGDYVEMLRFMKRERCLHKTLISHDAGWYDPEKPDGPMRVYTTLFEKLIPQLRSSDFTQTEIDEMIIRNPAEVFTIKKRLKKK